MAARAGAFEVEKVLAQSPRGRMYLARDASGNKVALKELAFAHAPDVLTIEAFEREGRVLATLEHPRIPRFVAAFQEGRGVHLRLYLAQQYVEGSNLLSQPRMSEAEALAVIDGILEVLVYLHERSPRLVHRDIKPGNVILRAQGEVALVDFDTARNMGSDVTYRSTMVGTTGYMAPEQYGGTVGPQSDLYSVGATLVHILSGEPPPIPQPDQTIDAEAKMNVSSATRAFIQRLTAWRLADRFPSAREARVALAEIILAPVAHAIAPNPVTLNAAPHQGNSVTINGEHVQVRDFRPPQRGRVIINGEHVQVRDLLRSPLGVQLEQADQRDDDIPTWMFWLILGTFVGLLGYFLGS